MNKPWISNAIWPLGLQQSRDCHETREQAEAVCEMLIDDGFGGLGDIFPLYVYVSELVTLPLGSIKLIGHISHFDIAKSFDDLELLSNIIVHGLRDPLILGTDNVLASGFRHYDALSFLMSYSLAAYNSRFKSGVLCERLTR